MKPLKGTLLGIGLMVIGYGVDIKNKLNILGQDAGVATSFTGGIGELFWMGVGQLVAIVGIILFIYHLRKLEN